jgi:hypothetical protein
LATRYLRWVTPGEQYRYEMHLDLVDQSRPQRLPGDAGPSDVNFP